MDKYYVVLTGARKNAGDFLITQKCKELIRKFRPEFELVQIGRWENLDDKLDIVNQSKGVILLGGPAFVPKMYPRIYRLVDDLNKIKVPIIPMAVGWNAYPGDFKSMIKFRFSSKSMELLRKISSGSDYISVRDFYTNQILKMHGINNSIVTGCAALFDLKSIGKAMHLTSTPKAIAFTPAQNIKYAEITIELMKRLRNIFKDTRIICAFHRGIGKKDKYTSKIDAKNTRRIALIAEKLGMEVADLSFSHENYRVYDGVDVHVGFRVHAHLYFLSRRYPSLLINEDGRGSSISKTLNIYGVDAFYRRPLGEILHLLDGVFQRLSLCSIKHDVKNNVPEVVECLLRNHLESGFIGFAGVSDVIDNYFGVMKKFLQSLPN
ncbi:MAG TPA: hypothetical protein DER56_04280 [Thermosipho africanus]|nr:hypothetical protein [Thermosipho africanus]